jgi:hypothetical protein
MAKFDRRYFLEVEPKRWKRWVNAGEVWVLSAAMLIAATYLWFSGFQQPPFPILLTLLVGVSCSAFGIGFIFLKENFLTRLHVLIIQVNIGFGACAACFSFFLVQA